jgi:SNF2 family DNA or RNA helicase
MLVQHGTPLLDAWERLRPLVPCAIIGRRQMRAYIRAEREGVRRLLEMGPDIPIACILELILRLKQLCNRDPVSGESSKMLDIQDRLRELSAEGHRSLVISQFTDGEFGVKRLAWELRAFSPIQYTGAMKLDEREEAIRSFRENPIHNVMLLSLKAGGLGLNLQAASYVFHLDRWWNPAIEDQAESRAHRMGQTEPVTVYRYTARGTIEQRIEEILAAKRQLFAEVVDDATIDLENHFTKHDLLGRFGL